MVNINRAGLTTFPVQIRMLLIRLGIKMMTSYVIGEKSENKFRIKFRKQVYKCRISISQFSTESHL